jgi:hypothetical protein
MAVTQTLSVYEVLGSVDTVNNTSRVRILWQSTQSGDSHNDYSRTAKYWVNINQSGSEEYAVAYTLPQNTTKIIVDKEITVKHRADGSGIVQVYTKMDTGISAGVVEKSAECKLTTIPRASTISSSTPINQVDAYCDIRWTPLSKDFRYKLKFEAGSYSYTTGAIHPNTLSEYKYDDYFFSFAWADTYKIIPSDKDRASISVTLYTYSDSGCTTLVGSSSGTLTVKLNQDLYTKPSITMSLSPADSPIADAYLQGRSKVKATFSGSGKLGATISSTSYSLKVGGKTYTDPYTSDILSASGDITVYGYVTDSRGFTNFTYQTINVSAYDKPSVIPYTGKNNIVCERCNSDGTPDGGGIYLLIKIGRRYSKVVSGGSQKNFCTLSYSYKTDAQAITEYSKPITILSESATDDYVSVILPNVVGSITTAYNIRLIAEDTAGERDIITITVPTAFVTFHAPPGGHGFTLGGYHDMAKEDVFDCKFDAEFEGVVRGNVYGLLGSSGDIPSDGDLDEYLIPGIYAVPSNVASETIQNIPTKGAGLLRVYASTGQDDVTDGNWKYLMQEYRPCDAALPLYRRAWEKDGIGTWRCGKWIADNGLILNSGIDYVSAGIYMISGVETCQLIVQQGENYHVISFTPSGIEYGKNGGVYWKK